MLRPSEDGEPKLDIHTHIVYMSNYFKFQALFSFEYKWSEQAVRHSTYKQGFEVSEVSRFEEASITVVAVLCCHNVVIGRRVSPRV